MTYKYLMFDSRGNLVAHATSVYAPRGKEWKMVIDDDDVEEAAKHSYLSLVGDSDAVPAMEGRILRWEGKTVVLEPVRPLEQKDRQNLRVPARFVSYLYSVSGAWKGRVPIVSHDLCSGGLAFFCPRSLQVGEQVQVVIPVTANPLLLDMEILRCRSGPGQDLLYAGKFLSMLREAESMVREAVFHLQRQKN